MGNDWLGTLLVLAECGRASRSTVVRCLPGQVELHVLSLYSGLAAAIAVKEFGRLWSKGCGLSGASTGYNGNGLWNSLTTLSQQKSKCRFLSLASLEVANGTASAFNCGAKIQWLCPPSVTTPVTTSW